MTSIWERVQICRQTATIAPNYFILRNKNQLEPDAYLMLLQGSCCWRKTGRVAEGGECKACAFFFFFTRAFALEGERRAERSAEGQFKWREAEMSFSDLFASEIKLYQQAGADRNWIKKPSGLPLKSMNTIFVYAWTTLDHPPASLKNTYNDASCAMVSHVFQ